mgnify:CR=1 FL=1
MEKIIPWGLLIAQLKHESTPEQDVLFDAWIKETDNAELFVDITLLWDKIQEEVSEAKPDLAVSWEKMQLVYMRANINKEIYAGSSTQLSPSLPVSYYC